MHPKVFAALQTIATAHDRLAKHVMEITRYLSKSRPDQLARTNGQCVDRLTEMQPSALCSGGGIG